MKTLPYILTLFILSGCGKEDNDSNHMADPKFKPATGLVLVKNGSLDEIKKAILDYDELVRDEYPKDFKVEIQALKNGYAAVMFPEGFPSYDLVNITGWLNAPPDQPNVDSAISWLVSPEQGTKYFLKPEATNKRGDTLIGASVVGPAIRVYLPEAGVSEISDRVGYVNEPDLQFVGNLMKITISLDTNTQFGNPSFVVNAPFNSSWGY